VPCRFEGNAEEIRSEVHAMQQQVRVLAGEKEDLHHQLHSEQQRSRQHLAQVITSDYYFQAFVFMLCQDSQVATVAADLRCCISQLLVASTAVLLMCFFTAVKTRCCHEDCGSSLPMT